MFLACAQLSGLALPPLLAPAEAQATQHLDLAADECPSTALLREQLGPLLGDGVSLEAAPEQATDGREEVEVEVRDLGGEYVIRLDAMERRILDEARDCVERARVSAVLVALNLRRPAPAPPAAQSAAPAEPSSALGLRVALEGTHAFEPAATIPGASLALWLRHHAYRLELGAGAMVPATFELSPTSEGAGVDVLRIPLTLTASHTWGGRSVWFGPSAGLALELLRIEGVGVDQPETALRLAPGATLGLDLGLGLSRGVGLFARLWARAFPRAYALRVAPDGPSAQTPRLWLGLSLGLDVTLHP